MRHKYPLETSQNATMSTLYPKVLGSDRPLGSIAPNVVLHIRNALINFAMHHA